jgi:hypothetical protein
MTTTTKFKTLIAAALLAGASQAHAAPSAALTCSIGDIAGNALTYAFGPNSTNADGSLGGTMVEAAFDKNGTSTISVPGRRPIWIFKGYDDGSINLFSRSAPGWTISVGPSGAAQLTHNGQLRGAGSCAMSATTAGNVVDQGL